MRIRFYNARVCSMVNGSTEVVMGEVHTEDEVITFSGDGIYEAGLTFDREIDLKGDLILPGFKNAHTHSAMTFLRSYADDLPLHEWLQNQIFPMEAKLSDEDAYHLSKLAILEYLTSGITANFDMYYFQDSVAKASIDMGFRTVLCGVETKIEKAEEVHKKYRGGKFHELITSMIGFHSQYTTTEPFLKDLATLAQKYKSPVYTHNSETKHEVALCIEQTGMTPTVYLDSLSLFENGGGGYHCVHMTEEDMDIFVRRGMSVVTNPGSNVKLASGIAPLERMREKGIRIALGTDGPASNNALDFFREMYLATALQKIAEEDASALPAEDVLKMATYYGAHAMGLSQCDTLEVGKLADLIVIDLQQPNMQPINAPVKNLVYSGSKQNVKLSMIAGKILYEDGVFQNGIQPEKIYEKANEIITRLR